MPTNQTPAPQATIDSVPPDKPDGTLIDNLVGLIKEMEPFIDRFGIVHCMMPAGNSIGRSPWRLNDEAVHDLIMYRYSAKYGEPPSARDISTAMAIVKGELWDKRREPIIEDTCPVLRAMCKAVEMMESWQGSAGDLLKLLQTLGRDNNLLKRGEELPKTADAMGVWLANNGLRLRGHGIELYRPKPTAQKRLWAWQRVSRADTSDGQESGAVSSGNDKQAKEIRQSDTCDTLTPEQNKLLTILQGTSK